MNRTIFGAMVVVLSACMLGMNGAWADGGPVENVEHQEAGCNSTNRLTHSESTCLTATWRNTRIIDRTTGETIPGRVMPSYTVTDSSTWDLTNDCALHGSIVANIDMRWSLTTDRHAHLRKSDASSTLSGASTNDRVKDISCCTDLSDLCLKQEVEADTDGIIKRRTSGTAYVDVSVATHEDRYAFCQEYPNSIYCRVDPSGDAFTEPPPPLPDPSLQTCYDNWTASQASSHCTDFQAETSGGESFDLAEQRRTLALPDNRCHHVRATCGSETLELFDSVLVTDVSHTRFCSGTIRRCVWDPDGESYTTDDDSSVLLVNDICPSELTVWEGGPATDPTSSSYNPMEDGEMDCNDLRGG